MQLEIPARIRPALTALLEALRYSEMCDNDPWEFALAIDELAELGLSLTDFRWLVRQKLVEHQREITLEGQDGRYFSPGGDLQFRKNSCFVLTNLGFRIATQVFAAESSGTTTGPTIAVVPHPERAAVDSVTATVNSHVSAADSLTRELAQNTPRWDAKRRELYFGVQLVKRFKWPAANQEAILEAFEEEGWPARVDDPLSPHSKQDSKRRLSDAIKCLNRKHVHQLLHFRGDGTGEGIIWEELSSDDASPK